MADRRFCRFFSLESSLALRLAKGPFSLAVGWMVDTALALIARAVTSPGYLNPFRLSFLTLIGADVLLVCPAPDCRNLSRCLTSKVEPLMVVFGTCLYFPVRSFALLVPFLWNIE